MARQDRHSMITVKVGKSGFAFCLACVVGFLIGCEYASRFHCCDTVKRQSIIEFKIEPEQNRHLPHAIVIGVRKAGTRALLKFLRLHPDVVFKGEEMNFFDEEKSFARGLDFYRNEMPPSCDYQITMEKTPSYFTDPLVPERIYNMNSSIRLVLILRDPVMRLVSDYVDGKEKASRNISTTLYPSLESLVIDSNGNVDRHYSPVIVSTYHIHFSNWLKHFPRDQIHIADGDNFIENPAEELNTIETFLGLRHNITRDTFYFNNTKGFYCVRRFGKGAEKHKCLGQSKGRKHPHLDSVLLSKLKSYFQHPNELFFKLAGRRFSW